MAALNITAINLSTRTALASDDTFCMITNLLDADGDETSDTSEALVAIVKYDEDNWFTVQVANFSRALNG